MVTLFHFRQFALVALKSKDENMMWYTAFNPWLMAAAAAQSSSSATSDYLLGLTAMAGLASMHHSPVTSPTSPFSPSIASAGSSSQVTESFDDVLRKIPQASSSSNAHNTGEKIDYFTYFYFLDSLCLMHEFPLNTYQCLVPHAT